MKGIAVKKVIICLTLCFAVSGVAQHPNRVANILPEAVKKALVYVGLPLMLCFTTSCDSQHRTLKEVRRELRQKEAEQITTEARQLLTETKQMFEQLEAVPVTVLEVTSQQVGTTANQDGSWYQATSKYPNSNYLIPGVYSDKQSDAFNYYPIKLYNEIEELIPDALQVGWAVLYEKEDRYFRSSIASISEHSLSLVYPPNETIDSSQVLAVIVLGSNHYLNKWVMFSPKHVMLSGTTDANIVANIALLAETNDLFLYGTVGLPYTNDTFSVLIEGYGKLILPSKLLVVMEYSHALDRSNLLVQLNGEHLTLLKEKKISGH